MEPLGDGGCKRQQAYISTPPLHTMPERYRFGAVLFRRGRDLGICALLSARTDLAAHSATRERQLELKGHIG